MQTGITAIYEVEDLGTTPARVNRKTGELYINMKKWATMTPEARLFVLLHEAGHVDQDTRSEFMADNYAFYAYAREGKPLSKAVTALTRLLSFDNPQHYDRLRAQMHRVFAYDYKVNGNDQANPEIMEAALFQPQAEQYNYFSSPPKHSMKVQRFEDIHGTAIAPGQESEYSDLFGIGKSKAARQAAQLARQQKRADKKINKERTKGAAERAKMGLEDGPPVPSAPAAAGTGNSKILIFAGAGAALLILVIVFFIKRKK